MCKKYYSWNPSTCIFENSKYLKSIVDNSVIVCDKIITVMDSISTNVTNTISVIATSTVSINSDDKRVRYKMNCYILHTFYLATIVLFIIVIIAVIMENMGKKYQNMNNIKIDKNNELKGSGIKNS